MSGNRNVSKSGDEVTVDRNVQSTSGASKSSQKTYEMDDGRVESVERNTQATNRQGQTASYEGKAERSGAGWEFEGEGNNRYGQEVEAEGYGARGRYGSGVVADVEGGRYGDRTVVAGRAYGGPVYASQLPYGARPYPYHGRSYYAYGGAYYRPYAYRGVHYYGYMPPPWGCYYSTVPVGAIALTVAGMALLYSDGTYYKTTYVEGATQYQVVAPAGRREPARGHGAARRPHGPHHRRSDVLRLRQHFLQARGGERQGKLRGGDQAGGRGGGQGPARGRRADAGRQHHVLPLQEPLLPHLPRSQRRGAVHRRGSAGRCRARGAERAPTGQASAAPAAPASAAPKPAVASLNLPPGTPLTVRVSTEINSGTAKAGQRFQGNLDADLVADGRVVATRGTRAYGRVVSAKAGTGTGGAPALTIELTDIEVGGRVIPLSTDPQAFTGEAKKAGKKVLGGAALGAGIGAMVDGGEGAAWGAGIGAGGGRGEGRELSRQPGRAGPGHGRRVSAGQALDRRRRGVSFKQRQGGHRLRRWPSGVRSPSCVSGARHGD